MNKVIDSRLRTISYNVQLNMHHIICNTVNVIKIGEMTHINVAILIQLHKIIKRFLLLPKMIEFLVINT